MAKTKFYDGAFVFLAVALLFGYGVSLLERGQDEEGKVDVGIVKEVVYNDVERAKEKASQYYAESKTLYPDGYNQKWYNENVND